jgi:hypothetical protein
MQQQSQVHDQRRKGQRDSTEIETPSTLETPDEPRHIERISTRRD